MLVDLLIDSIPFRLKTYMLLILKRIQKIFFKKISKNLVTSGNLNLRGVGGGDDFNCILDTKYDKIGKGANPQFGHIGSKELINLCKNII